VDSDCEACLKDHSNADFFDCSVKCVTGGSISYAGKIVPDAQLRKICFYLLLRRTRGNVPPHLSFKLFKVRESYIGS
jgi:hypothetical protein